MFSFPSSQNSTNARREMRMAHKAIAKKNAVKLTPEQQLQRGAAELVKENLVMRVDAGFIVSASRFGFIRYQIREGKCTCFGFADHGRCVHAEAARIFAANEDAERRNSLSSGITTEKCGCRYNYDDHFTETYCAGHLAERFEDQAMECDAERRHYEQ